MKIEKRQVNNGIMQITTLDERWYEDELKMPDIYFPSSSWICGYYPKGIQYYKWLADKGWDEAEQIKTEKGKIGSKVHAGIETLLRGNPIKMTDKYYNDIKGIDEEFTPYEWSCLMDFKEWYGLYKPEIMLIERSAVNTEIGYGGTIDCVAKIGEQVYLIDWKTSQSIWKSYHLQISSYKHLLPYIEETKHLKLEEVKVAVLQVGYMKNKIKHWKFTEIPECMNLFMNAKEFWAEENKNKQPKQKDYPLEIKLDKIILKNINI